MPGLLLIGAAVLSPEPLLPGAAVAILNGRIVAVDSHEAAASALPDDHDVVDLTGRCLTPGFIDAHLHPLPMAFFEHHLDLAHCTSIHQVLDVLTERAVTLGPEEFVLGMRVDDAALAEQRLPTRAELDEACGGRPVVLLRRDGHHGLGSSAALAAAGFTSDSSDPPGGYLERDGDGELTGLCGESASSMLMATIPSPEWREFEQATARWAERLLSQGVTAISAICQTGAEGPAGAAGALEAVAWAAFAPALPFDVQTILIAEHAADVVAMRSGSLHEPAEGRRLDGFKIFLDGTLGGHTACLHLPYADDPTEGGMLTLPIEEVERRMVDAHLAGLSICVHAIGDRANDLAAQLFETMLTDHPRPDLDAMPHRIEHASVLDAETIDRLARIGVAAVVQPIFIESERSWLHQRLGDDRIAHTYPFRALLDAGVTVAGSSDAPIEATDVLAAIHAAVDRHGIAPGQAIDPIEALALFTTGASAVRGTRHEMGSIAVGQRADLVVLSGDLREATTGIDVVATLIGGEVAYGELV